MNTTLWLRRAFFLALAGAIALASVVQPQPTRGQDSSSVLAPRVISTFPAPREVVGPEAALQIIFDQPMNRASVETAFSITPIVNGAIAWADDTTFTFTPIAPLQRGQEYQIALAPEALAASGTPLGDLFRLTFRVSPNLEVSQTIPANSAEEVEASSSLTIIFDRPVVPLATTGDQANFPSPITVSPPVQGKGEWLGTAIYSFKPSIALAGGTLYTVSVDPNLKDVDGTPLGNPYTWQFRTIVPRVNSLYPADGQTLIPLKDPYLVIEFNQPMDRGSLLTAITLRNLSTGADVASTFVYPEGYQEAYTTVNIVPAAPLSLDTAYTLSVLPSARSASGEATLSNPQAITFTTVPLPKVDSTYPANGAVVPVDNSVQIAFNAPMDFSSFKDAVKISPEVEDFSLGDGGSTLYIYFKQKPNTTYTITLDGKAADPYGNTIGEPYTFSFKVDNLPADLGLASPYDVNIISAYRPETLIKGAGVNISAVEFELGKLEQRQFFGIFNEYGYPDLYNYAPPSVTRSWTQPIEFVRNDKTPFSSNLAESGALPVGYYYLQAFAPEFRRFLQPDARPPSRTLIVVANTALSMKRDAYGNVLVWATDLKTGQPTANLKIALYNRDQQALAEAVTDADGLARIAYKQPLDDYRTIWAVATGEGLFGVTGSNFQSGVGPYEFGVGIDTQPVKTNIYLYTDQPIYRPGRPVYYRGIVRAQDDVTFTLPTAGQTAQLLIYDPNGKELANKPITLNEFGGFNGQFDLDPQGVAMLGGYNIQVLYNGQYGYLGFTVAEFRPPEFLVNASAEKTEVAVGEAIRVTTDAKFLFGGPVSGASISWVAVANRGYFGFFGEGRYEFDNLSAPFNYQVEVGRGTGVLDANGQFVIDFMPTFSGPVSVKHDITIEATVTDISNQQISGRTNVILHPAEFYIGLAPQKYVGRATEPQIVDIATTDWASAPVANKALTVRAQERSWQQDPTTLNWEQKLTVIAEGQLTTDAEGKAQFTFTPPQAGVYEIYAEGRDSRERLAVTTTTLYIAGPGAAEWNRDNKNLLLVADRKGSYEPGETASILIPSPFPEKVRALVTVERAQISKTEVIEIEGSTTYNVLLSEADAPNVFVSVLLVRGSGDDFAHAPELRLGLLSLEVAVKQRLKVTLTPDVAQTEPGQTVTFAVQTTDLAGAARPAEIGLSLSDVATLSVGLPNSLPIFDNYYSLRALSVITTSSYGRGIDALDADDVGVTSIDYRARREEAAGGGADGLFAAPPGAPAAVGKAADAANESDASAQASAPTPRSDFVDTPLWKADLVTDADGRASISVKMPDNLTTWRLDARAISVDSFVGDAQIELISTKPLLVRPATPRFLVVGDEVELAMVVNNNSGQDLDVQVSLDAKGVRLRAEAAQTVRIANGGRVRVAWLATVEDVEAADLAFTAISGNFSDASKPAVGVGPERLLPVYKYLTPDYASTAGVLRTPGQRLEGLFIPSEELAPSGEVTVNLSPSLAAATLDSLTALRNFEYQCLEQTVSRFLPNVVTYRALQKTGYDDPKLKADLDAAVAYALDRLTREQRPDGGWGWYYAEESSPLTTAYALLGLAEARDADYAVNRDMIDRAVAFLYSGLGTISDNDPAWELNRKAFVAYVLARVGSANPSLMADLLARREKTSLDARAYLALAYDQLRSSGQDVQGPIDTLLSDIQTRAIASATGIHWEEDQRDYWNWGSNTRTTAIIVQTLARLTPQSELLPNAVRWLMVARRGDFWQSTQETAWAVMGLTEYMVASGELKADFTYTVALNGQTLGEGVANAETLTDTKTLTASVNDLLRAQVNKLTFDHAAGDGSLYYTATLHVDQPVELVRATNRGFGFSRTYYVNGKPVTSAKVGDVITVVLEFTTNSDTYYSVINDPIPAGTEAIDRSLQTTGRVGEQPSLSLDDIGFYGWGWWWFSDVQLKTEKVVLTAQYLPRGNYRFVYQLLATTPGIYRVIPANGHEFYFPEVFGRGDGGLFTVNE
jgi:alpha-2-macroglobulin